MPPHIASCVFAVVILSLFWLDRDRHAKYSLVLWVPVVWLFLACSRSVSQWMRIGQPLDFGSVAEQVAEGNPLDRLVYTGLVILGLAILVGRGRKAGRLLRANFPILLFFAYCLLSLVWSDFPDVGFKRWIKALGDFIMVLVVLTDREMFSALKRFLAWSSFLLLPLSVLFVKYYPEIGKIYGRWDYKAMYTGVSTSKNTLGAICLVFGLASIWRLLAGWKEPRSKQRNRQLVAHAIVLGMALWLFWMANSMTSFNCFLIGGLFLVAASMRFMIRRPRWAELLAVFLVAGAVSVLFAGVGQGVLSTIGRDPTLTDRTSVWAVVLPLPPSALVGTGFESFWLGPRLQKIWSVFPWEPFEAHNGYIEVFLNLGWVGIALLAVVIVAGYRTTREGYRRDPAAYNLRLTLFVIGLIYNCTEAAFFRMMAPVWIVLLLAIVHIPKSESGGPPLLDMLEPTAVVTPSEQQAENSSHQPAGIQFAVLE